MKPVHAYSEVKSGPGWRCTYFDHTGDPIASVWRENKHDAWRAMMDEVRRITR
jgi:hypothetical protein